MIYISAAVITGEGACPTNIETIRKFYGFDRPHHRDTRRPEKLKSVPQTTAVFQRTSDHPTRR
jgi:hypothetical protein